MHQERKSLEKNVGVDFGRKNSRMERAKAKEEKAWNQAAKVALIVF